MALLALELNDSGVLAASKTHVAEASPGYAVLDDEQFLIGAEAFAQARIHPRKINCSFWQQLSLERLERTSANMLTPADLAYAHLQSIYEPYRAVTDSVIIGVPPGLSKQQLGLLLGICKRAEIPVRGLVDSALAAVSHPVPGNRMLVVDATIHDLVITELRVENGLRRTDVTQLHNIGLKDFTARWASAIADTFVKTTRFDPMHTAASEQWLYDSIPGIVETLNAGADNVVISSADGNYETAVSADTLTGAVAGLYQPVINAITARELASEVTTVMFSARVATLPGLMAQLQHNSAFRVVKLPPLAVPKNILQERHAFLHDDKHLSLILQRPWQASPSLVAAKSGQVPVSRSRTAQVGTHVLVDALAYPVSDEALMLGTSLPANQWGHQVSGVVKGISRQHCLISQRGGQIVIDDKSTYGTFVNGKRVAGSQALNVGDRVQIGNPGIEVRIIRQVDSDGQA